jgi:hypothetical protein
MDETTKTAPDQVTGAIASTDSRLQRLFLLLDKPFRFAANLASLGLVSVIVAATIQYSGWRDEKNLTRHREELTSALATFADISGTLSAAMNLQQILFYTYREAMGYVPNSDDFATKHLAANAKAIIADYFITRTTLRKNIDVLIAKADLYIDRPTRSASQRIAADPPAAEPQVFSNRDVLRHEGFNCQQHMPVGWGRLKVGDIVLNWNQVRHHVATFYYCLEDIHSSLLPIRAWASTEVAGDDPRVKKILDENMMEDERIKLWIEKMDEIESNLDLQTKRLNAMIMLSTIKIEEIRLSASENGFFRHQFCFFC